MACIFIVCGWDIDILRKEMYGFIAAISGSLIVFTHKNCHFYRIVSLLKYFAYKLCSFAVILCHLSNNLVSKSKEGHYL